MTVSMHTLTVAAGDGTDAGRPLRVQSATLTLSDERAPYATASFEVVEPTDPAVRALLHPLGGIVQGTARVAYRDPIDTARVTAHVGRPTTAAAVTARHGHPVSPAPFTAALSAWGNTDPTPEGVIPFRLRIESVTGPRDGVLTVTAASREAQLIDWMPPASVAFEANRSLRSIILQVLLDAAPFAELETPGPDATIAVATLWEVGVDAWDFLAGLIEPTGYRFQCTPAGVFRLVATADPPETSVTLDHLTGYSVDDSRDDWADAILVRYRWRDAAGIEQTATDLAIAATGGVYQRMRFVEHATPYPGPGAAARILDRSLRLRRRLDLDAVNDLRVTPGRAILAAPPGGDPERVLVTTATFTWPAHTMRVATARTK